MDWTKLRCWMQDPTCPCNDGDLCHYEADETTPAFPIPDWMLN